MAVARPPTAPVEVAMAAPPRTPKAGRTMGRSSRCARTASRCRRATTSGRRPRSSSCSTATARPARSKRATFSRCGRRRADILYAYPDGTLDPTANRFWNADDACCDPHRRRRRRLRQRDHRRRLEQVQRRPETGLRRRAFERRVHVAPPGMRPVGSHRGNRGLAGAVWNDASKCNPIEPRLGARRARRRRHGDQLQRRCGAAVVGRAC